MISRIGASIALLLSLSLAACSGTASTPVAAHPAAGACNSGQPYSMQVYQDPFHVTPQCQFNPSFNAAAYVYVSNLAPADKYVFYVASSKGPNATRISASSAIAAVSGSLNFTWPMNSSLKPGPYIIAIYDENAGRVLASVQVTLE